MATTYIKKIQKSYESAISYITKNKKEPCMKDGSHEGIAYYVDDNTGEVTYITLNATLNCLHPGNPKIDFENMCVCYGRDELLYGNNKTKNGKPVLAWHLIQSFEESIDPIIANEIGQKLAESIFPGHPVVISTHTNKNNIHNHILASAWNYGGKKYCNNHAAYRKIRKVSDALCDEYGLNVLEYTRNQKLVKWTDKKGKVHYYEPTDRKNELIKMRKGGKLYADDVNSYRNSVSYEVSKKQKKTAIEIVKKALDEALPKATSYDHLLQMLRDSGFVVKDKKKNGDRLKHVTFLSPGAKQGVRDSNIDRDQGFYKRINLEKVIKETNKTRMQSVEIKEKLGLIYHEKYEYGITDIARINDSYRLERDTANYWVVKPRNEIEKHIIKYVKTLDKSLNGKNNTHFPETYKRQLSELIKEGLCNLSFIEKYEICSVEQIKNTVNELNARLKDCKDEIAKAKRCIYQINEMVKIYDKSEQIKNKINCNKNNEAYLLDDYYIDVAELKLYTKLLKSNNINDINNLLDWKKSAEMRVDDIMNGFNNLEKELSLYQKTAAYFDSIERLKLKSGDSHKKRDWQTTKQNER